MAVMGANDHIASAGLTEQNETKLSKNSKIFQARWEKYFGANSLTKRVGYKQVLKLLFAECYSPV